MTKKMTTADALALLADNAAANTKAVKELTALLGEVTTKPENGKNGETPYIKNGNWWIGTEDTGIAAAIKMPIEVFEVKQELQAVELNEDLDYNEMYHEIYIDLEPKYIGWAYVFSGDVHEDGKVNQNGRIIIRQKDINSPYFSGLLFLYKPKYISAVTKFISESKPKEVEKGIVLSSLNDVEITFHDGHNYLNAIVLKGTGSNGELLERYLESGKDDLKVIEINGNSSEYTYIDTSSGNNGSEGEFYPGEDGNLSSQYSLSVDTKEIRFEISTKEGFTFTKTVRNPNYLG